jgi:hypothetical protein
MEKVLLALPGEDIAFAVFCFSAVVCLVFGFLIVCYARPLGNKLLLLGLLIALTAFVFAATMPTVARLAFVMLAIAVILVLTGVVVSVISHFSGSSKSD